MHAVNMYKIILLSLLTAYTFDLCIQRSQTVISGEHTNTVRIQCYALLHFGRVLCLGWTCSRVADDDL